MILVTGGTGFIGAHHLGDRRIVDGVGDPVRFEGRAVFAQADFDLQRQDLGTCPLTRTDTDEGLDLEVTDENVVHRPLRLPKGLTND